MYSRNQLCAVSSGPNIIQNQARLSDFQGCTEQLFPHSTNSRGVLMWNFTVIVINGPSYFIISFNQLYYSSNVSVIFYEQYLQNTNKNDTINLIHSPSYVYDYTDRWKCWKLFCINILCFWNFKDKITISWSHIFKRKHMDKTNWMYRNHRLWTNPPGRQKEAGWTSCPGLS